MNDPDDQRDPYEDLSFKEFLDFEEEEQELERQEFAGFLRKFDIENYLSQDEIQVVYDLWNTKIAIQEAIEETNLMAPKDRDFAIDYAKIRELSMTRSEAYFVKIQKTLRTLDGWMSLPNDNREKAEAVLAHFDFESGIL